MIDEKINKLEVDINLLKQSMEIISTLVKEQDESLNTIENEITKSCIDTKESLDDFVTSSEYNYSKYYIYLSSLGALFIYLFL